VRVVCPVTEGLWIATGLSPRDDKGGVFYHEGSQVVEFSLCHCEKDRLDDAAIHRVSVDAVGVDCSVSDSQWIATGLRPRDDNSGIFTMKGVK
jgi:hypothetical protein